MNLSGVGVFPSALAAPPSSAVDSARLATGQAGDGLQQVALPASRAAAAMAPEAFEEVRGEVAGTVSALTGRVRSALASLDAELCASLEKLESLAASLTPTNTLEVKRDIRQVLWAVRQGLEKGPAEGTSPEIRKALEDARSVAFDCIREQSSYPTSHETIRPRAQDVPNYAEISPSLRRGAQVDSEGAEWLVAHGVRSEIDLRGTDRDNQWFPAAWPNVRRYQIAVDDMQPPTFEQVEQFLREVNDEANQPVFVHCKAGIGRTGTMVACWRITRGATAEEALEAERLFSGVKLVQPQADFVRSFEVYWRTERRQA